MPRRETTRSWQTDPERTRKIEYPEPTALVGYGQTRALTEFAAMMECLPGQDPDLSRTELLPLRDVIADAIDALPDNERWAFEALVIRRLSERQLAQELRRPRRTVRRWRDAAVTHLQLLLSDHPLVLEHLHRGEFDE